MEHPDLKAALERQKDPKPQPGPQVQHVLQFFEYDHLPGGPIRTTSAVCSSLAHHLAEELGDGPELTVALRLLLQAKDAFVRQAVLDSRR